MPRLNQSRRQLIGYVYPQQVNNNIATISNNRPKSSIDHFNNTNEMSGDGFMDIVRDVIGKAKTGAKYLYDHRDNIADAYTSELGTTLRNMIPDSDNTARPGFAGEKHMILELKNGKNGVANYMGPGTQVVQRLKREDPGRTPSDMVAKRHDIDYAIAQSARTKADQLTQVRAADNRMIKSLQKLNNEGGDANRNIQAGMRLIQAKKLGEDSGILSKDKFVGNLRNIPDDEKILLMSNRARLTQQGYGLSIPGAGLKKKILRGISRSKTLPDSKGYTMSGEGEIANFIADKALPSLTKHLGLPDIPRNVIKKVVDMAMNRLNDTGKIGDKIESVAKYMIPILTHMQLKNMGRSTSGGGLSIKSFTKVPKLQKLLKVALMKSIHNQMSGKGKSISGGSFWSDFKKGFTSVFKPFATVGAPIISALGVPEIGIPLGIVGNLL